MFFPGNCNFNLIWRRILRPYLISININVFCICAYAKVQKCRYAIRSIWNYGILQSVRVYGEACNMSSAFKCACVRKHCIAHADLIAAFIYTSEIAGSLGPLVLMWVTYHNYRWRKITIKCVFCIGVMRFGIPNSDYSKFQIPQHPTSTIHRGRIDYLLNGTLPTYHNLQHEFCSKWRISDWTSKGIISWSFGKKNRKIEIESAKIEREKESTKRGWW